MPDIDLLEPRVINGVVQKFPRPQSFMGLSMMGSGRPHPFPSWQYDVITPGRNRASITTPGAIGKIVTRTTIGSLAGGFMYSREKKIFDPATLHWLRAPGEVAANNAEREVMRELLDLSNRFDRLHEWAIWQMLQGQLDYTSENSIVSINYLISNAHKPTAAALWTDPSSNPIENVRSWKQLIAHDSHSVATEVFLNTNTMGMLQDNSRVRSMLSDTMRQRYLETGVLTRFQNLNWVEYDLGYVDSNDTFQTYIPDGKIIIVSNEDAPFVMLDGPSADDEAPDGFTGRFTKTWKEKDPSARQVLMEQNRIPILLRPEQIVVATVDS